MTQSTLSEVPGSNSKWAKTEQTHPVSDFDNNTTSTFKNDLQWCLDIPGSKSKTRKTTLPMRF